MADFWEARVSDSLTFDSTEALDDRASANPWLVLAGLLVTYLGALILLLPTLLMLVLPAFFVFATFMALASTGATVTAAIVERNRGMAHLPSGLSAPDAGALSFVSIETTDGRLAFAEAKGRADRGRRDVSRALTRRGF